MRGDTLLQTFDCHGITNPMIVPHYTDHEKCGGMLRLAFSDKFRSFNGISVMDGASTDIPKLPCDPFVLAYLLMCIRRLCTNKTLFSTTMASSFSSIFGGAMFSSSKWWSSSMQSIPACPTKEKLCFSSPWLSETHSFFFYAWPEYVQLWVICWVGWG